MIADEYYDVRSLNRKRRREIGPDDCVWDVGANVGYYTERFAARARRVVAFEPIAENMASSRLGDR